MSSLPVSPIQPVPATFWLIRFRLVHIVYVVTLLATSLATFGTYGILLWCLISIFWASVFTSRSRPNAFRWACVVTAFCLCLISLLLPKIQAGREASRRSQCINNLRQIGIALHGYHEDFGSLPPAYVTDENGKPMHSWRVLILPFMERQPLYDKYDFDEPWNGPNNSELLQHMPRVYACPAHGRGTYTSYVAVVGPATAWPGQTGSTFAQLRDGMRKTVLLIEHNNQNIPWMEPRDLEFDEALELLVSGNPVGSHPSEDFFYEYFTGRSVLFADVSIQFVDHGTSPAVWSAMLGVNDGVAWDHGDLTGRPTSSKRLKVANCLRLALFVVLTLFPLPWVWLNPTSTTIPVSLANGRGKA